MVCKKFTNQGRLSYMNTKKMKGKLHFYSRRISKNTLKNKYKDSQRNLSFKYASMKRFWIFFILIIVPYSKSIVFAKSIEELQADTLKCIKDLNLKIAKIEKKGKPSRTNKVTSRESK